MVAALTCPACHDGGYLLDDGDAVPCDHRHHADPVAAIQAMTVDELVASIPGFDTFGTQRWCVEVGAHLTRAQWAGVRDRLLADIKAGK